jgi:hypothetical protein
MTRMKAFWGCIAILMLLMVLSPGKTVLQAQDVCIAGVYWYSDDEDMINMSLPYGKRGWNIECIYDSGNAGPAITGAQKAKEDGLVNMIRISYRNGETVPRNSANHWGWANEFRSCIQTIGGNADYYIVGNEPPLADEGAITASQYVSAFNYLWNFLSSERAAGKKLLIAGPNAFGPNSLNWLNYVAAYVTDASGISIHTYGDPNECWDPQDPCNYHPEWWFDSGFQYFRDQLNQLGSRWDNKPVFITEINTDRNGLNEYPNPIHNYRDNWINDAMAAVRTYNNSSEYPKIFAVCWFVDRADSPWGEFALRNIPVARNDMRDAFHNPANGGSCGNLADILIAEGDAHQLIYFNKYAALQKEIFQHGFCPNSNEFSFWCGGNHYTAQRAEHLDTGEVRVYYCLNWNWSIVYYVVRGQQSGDCQQELIDQGEAHQLIYFNKYAALQKKIFQHGFVPNSNEFDVVNCGISYVAQRAEHLDTGQVRVYYCIKGQWQNVYYVVRPW